MSEVKDILDAQNFAKNECIELVEEYIADAYDYLERSRGNKWELENQMLVDQLELLRDDMKRRVLIA